MIKNLLKAGKDDSMFEKSISGIHLNNRLKIKGHMIISIDTEKAKSNIHKKIHTQTLGKWNRRKLPQLEKSIYKK